MAALWKLPILFVVENNQWAIGMAHHRSTSLPEIYKKASVFGIVGKEVDGMDVLAVREVAQKAIEQARKGEGPTLIEGLTYRYRGHSLADPDELRSKDEKEAWLSRDPIVRFETYLLSSNLFTSEELLTVQKNIKSIVDDSVKFAEASPNPKIEDLYNFIFA